MILHEGAWYYMKAAQNFIAAPISNDTDYIGVNFSKQECPGNSCMYQPGGDIFDSEVQVLPHICAVSVERLHKSGDRYVFPYLDISYVFRGDVGWGALIAEIFHPQ